MNTIDRTKPQSPLRNAPQHPQGRRGINWFRFWVQMFAAVLVFNIVAGLVTWFFIFPRLFPAH